MYVEDENAIVPQPTCERMNRVVAQPGLRIDEESECHDEIERRVAQNRLIASDVSADDRGMIEFRARFGHIERKLAERGKKPEDSNIAEMEALWQEAKR